MLTVVENSLRIKGNGTYNLPLIADDDGPVTFPKVFNDFDEEPDEIISATSIKNIINTNKVAVAKADKRPFLKGYYIGEASVTSNELIICVNNRKVIDEALLNRWLNDGNLSTI